MNSSEITELQKAEVLIEALPYIQRFNRKIIVVKYGGSAMVYFQAFILYHDFPCPSTSFTMVFMIFCSFYAKL